VDVCLGDRERVEDELRGKRGGSQTDGLINENQVSTDGDDDEQDEDESRVECGWMNTKNVFLLLSLEWRRA